MGDDPAALCFGEAIPEEIRSNCYGPVSVTPARSPELGFRLVLPTDWKPITDIPMATLEFESFSLAAWFKASDEVSFQALATIVPHEVNLEDWLAVQSEVHGFQLLRAESKGGDQGQVVHGVGRAQDGAYLRLLATGNGPSVLLCLGRMPEGGPDSVRQTLGLAAATFQLTDTCVLPMREPMSLFSDRDRMFRFLYPESWSSETLDSLRPDKAGANFRISDETEAYLRIEADRRQPRDAEGLDRILQIVLQEIADAGMTIREFKPQSQKDGALPEQWSGACQLGGSPAQIAIMLRPVPQCWLTAIALYPTREADAWAWMRGKRAYELAVSSLEPATPVQSWGASSRKSETQKSGFQRAN